MNRFVWLIAAMGAVSAGAQAGELRIGTAIVDITPEPGTPMLTPMVRPSVKLAEPAHDPLCVRAIVLESGGVKAAIAACDLTSIPNHMFAQAKAEIAAATGIDRSHVMISATHTHTAPQIRKQLLGKVDDAARAKSIAYIDALPAKMGEAIIKAHGQLKPAVVSAGIGRETSISFNRRFMMKDGTVMTNPGKDKPELHEQILRPAGPIDPDVGVVSFESTEHAPLATLVNFALHLDTDGGGAPTADFPATLHKTLAEARGAEALSLFAIGAAGNINHYNLLDPKGPIRVKGHAESARIGGILAAEVLRTLPRMQPLENAPLRVASETVTIEMPREKGAALAAQHQNAETFYDGEVTVTNRNGKQTFEAEVQVIALGNELAWVGWPGEMFTEFGLAVKNASPFKYTMVHELANTSIGYVPNLRSYPEGGYEATYTRCAPGTGEMLVATATELLVALKYEQSRDARQTRSP